MTLREFHILFIILTSIELGVSDACVMHLNLQPSKHN